MHFDFDSQLSRFAILSLLFRLDAFMTIYYANGSETNSLTTEDLRDALRITFEKIGSRQKVLLLPPDHTRLFSRAGELTVLCRDLLGDAVTDIMPALGTHSAMKPD